MTDKLREAAETILRCVDKLEIEIGTLYATNNETGMGLAEAWELANAYIAEHPEDDDEPVTFEASDWLDSVLPNKQSWQGIVEWKSDPTPWGCYVEVRWIAATEHTRESIAMYFGVEHSMRLVAKFPSRRQVRDLLRVLKGGE